MTPSFNGWVVVFLIIILCSAIKRSVRGYGFIVVRPHWARCEFLAELLLVLIL